MQSKFKMDDKVICISKDNYKYEEWGAPGFGWEKGFIFNITNITASRNTYIYWAGIHQGGVFEEALKLIKCVTQTELLKLKGLI